MTSRAVTRKVAAAGCHFAGGLSAIALVICISGTTFQASTAAAATDAGTARVVKPDHPSDGALVDIGAGGSATPFTLSLPTRSACKGDSANDGYRVQSYMIPSTTNPGSVRFGSVGPQPKVIGAGFRQPLFTVTTDPYVNAQTANADHPGDPGYIINIAAFNFGVFKPGDIPPGTYNVGIACTRGPASATQTEKVWNAIFKISANPSDKPAGIAWSVIGGAVAALPPSAAPSSTTGSTSNGSGRAVTGPSPSSAAARHLPSAPASSSGGVVPSTGGSGADSASGSTGAPLAPAASVPAIASPAPGPDSAGGLPTASPAFLAVARIARLRSGSATSILVWAGLLLIFVRMAVLFARPPRLLTVEFR